MSHIERCICSFFNRTFYYVYCIYFLAQTNLLHKVLIAQLSFRLDLSRALNCAQDKEAFVRGYVTSRGPATASCGWFSRWALLSAALASSLSRHHSVSTLRHAEGSRPS